MNAFKQMDVLCLTYWLHRLASARFQELSQIVAVTIDSKKSLFLAYHSVIQPFSVCQCQFNLANR